jgi:hypothetical protein
MVEELSPYLDINLKEELLLGSTYLVATPQ